MSFYSIRGDRPLVYIAGALTQAGPKMLATYKEIRAGCGRAGFDSYLPHEDTGSRQSNISPRRVLESNLSAINRSVALVADVSMASHGVGAEFQYAFSRGIPVLAIARSRADVSRMILGHPALRGEVHRYSRVRQVQKLVADVLLGKELLGLGTARGRLIAIEGPDFVGKSTVARSLVTFLEESLGRPAVLVTDPPWNLSPWSEHKEIFGDEQLGTLAEAMLYLAARIDNFHRVIRPELEVGKVVVCDRFIDSWFAYQSTRLQQSGFEGPLELLLSEQMLLESFRVISPPGLTILLMAELDVLLERSRAREDVSLKYERPENLERVLSAYEDLHSRFPYRVARIETTGRSEEEVIRRATELGQEFLIANARAAGTQS